MKFPIKREQSQTGLSFAERKKFGPQVKKFFLWMMAAILVCGATMLTSCSKDDDATTDLNVAEKIIGKWVLADIDGQPALTNMKSVYTFISTTKAYMSASLTHKPEVGKPWATQQEAKVALEGNKVTLTFNPDEHNSAVHEFVITAINANEFTANQKVTVTIDGKVVHSDEHIFRLVKVSADYSEVVLGLWECTGLTGIETYNDAIARLEFLADGTYRYYRLSDSGQWQTVTTREFQDYFVDGTLLATRWKNKGENELREWWEIAALSGDQMVWTALRQNADGTTAQQKMTWKKIDLKVSEKIVGKWIVKERGGQPLPTNKMMVLTFASTTKAYMSESFNSIPDAGTLWNDKMEADVVIDGNKVTLTFHRNELHTGVHEFIFTDINDSEFTATQKSTSTVDGNVAHIFENTARYEKVPTDYSADIIGTWEGRCTSEGSVFDDGQEHRWQYNADGTYIYYVKDGDNWVPGDNTLNEYFVDGNLLCTRWVDNGVENREWWEVTIDGDKMNWTALRQNADGTTFTATFEMTKVE